MRKHRAFTLIELLVVIAIIALLIGVLVPALSAANRAAKKVKDGTQIASIEKAMFNWASSNKDNQYPPLIDPVTHRYGGTCHAAFATLLNGTSTRLTSVTTDPLPPAMFICPMSSLTPMIPYGVNPATGAIDAYTPDFATTCSFYDGPIHCSYGVLNSGEVNQGLHKGNNEGRYSNGRATVPLVYNALNYVWTQPPGHQICDWNRVATNNADDWKGHIGWADGHVRFSETPIVATVMNGKTYMKDNLHSIEDDNGPGQADAIMSIPNASDQQLTSNVPGSDTQPY